MQLDIGGLCQGEPRQWTLPVVTSLGWVDGFYVVKDYDDLVISLLGKVDGCKTEIITARLVLAENSKIRIDGVTGEHLDLEKQLQEIKTKRETDAAAQAEAERNAAELRARKDAADTRRKQQRAEADARYAKAKAEEEAKAAEERRKARTACTVIYRSTIDKKRSDLTVREEQQVAACQALGLYRPR